MNSVKLRSRAGADGILNLKVPVGVINFVSLPFDDAAAEI
jgi:hypothetical protein